MTSDSVFNKAGDVRPAAGALHQGFNASYVTLRRDVLGLVPEGARRVLDVGCAAGALGASIKQRSPAAVVHGIDRDAAMASAAVAVLDKVCVGDLNGTTLLDYFAGECFDVIIMADVLEHLIDPWLVVRQSAELLDPEGIVITSIPNVRHISTFLNLVVAGRWALETRGIHDRTHLRWFTRKNILEMLREAGLEPVSEFRHMRIIEGFNRLTRLNRFAWACDVPLVREYFVHQYVHVSKKRALQ